MQEETNLEQNAEVYEDINIEENTDGITQEETIEYIDVQEQEPYSIEVKEVLGWTSDTGDITHYGLTDRNQPDQHIIESITGLEDILADIQSLKSGLYTKSGGLAEFRKWEDGNPTWENRLGYFVSVINNGEISICDKQVSDVYGVAVSSGAFCGYQEDVDKSNNPLYAMVCLVGNVKVRIREGSDIVAGDYVVADNYGYAIKSESSVGFRVLSVGTDPILEYYASIALVPQNDNVGRVMENLKATNGEINNVIIQLGKIENTLVEVERNSSNAVKIAEDAKGLTDVLNEALGVMGSQLKDVTEVANQAKDSAERAISDANAIYTDAVATANSAKESANSALGDINTLKTNLNPLVAWEGEDGTSVAGFVAQADADHTELSSLVERWGENGTDVIAMRQQIDNNGASIQNLVAHADKYSVGPYSLSYGLTYDEAVGILKQGHIYVPTGSFVHFEESDLYVCKTPTEVAENTNCYFQVLSTYYGFTAPRRIYSNDTIKGNIASMELILDGEIYPINVVHDTTDMVEMLFLAEYEYAFESMTYEGTGKSYIWKEDIDNPGVYTWEYNSVVYFNPPENPQKDDLWYCLNGVTEDDKLIYQSETLYRFDGVQWVSVATIDGNLQARALGLVKQTANELTSTYTNLRGDVSVIKQDVNEISTTVANVEGEISSINQTADSIIAGTYDPEGSSSLSMLLDYSFKAVSEGRYHTRINSFEETTTAVGNRYSQPPSWSEAEGKFIFNEAYIVPDGKYYFNSYDQTIYCKDVNDAYEVYTIGNTAISSLDSRVSETESSISTLSQFNTDTNEAISVLLQKTDAGSAEATLATQGKFIICDEIKTELTEEERSAIVSASKYTTKPEWNKLNNGFIFDKQYDSEDGVYYILDDNTVYYQMIKQNGEIIGYEKYRISSSGSAYLTQKVDEHGSAIGMVVDNNGVKGTVLVDAINEQSSATISADKINIRGLVTFINGSSLNDLAKATIYNVEVQYALSDSSTDAPAAESTDWQPGTPKWEENKFVWQRTVTTYAKGDQSISDPVCIQGAQGQAGKDGVGVDIKGTAYIRDNDISVGASYSLYSNHEYTIQITNPQSSDAYLVDGYLFVYSGTDNKFTCAGKIQGPEGAAGTNASFVKIIPSAWCFKSTSGKYGEFTPDNICLYPQFQNVEYDNWKYSTDGGNTWREFDNSNGIVIDSSGVLTINKTSNLFTETTTSISFKCNTKNGAYDVVSITQIYDVVNLELGRNLLLDSGVSVTNDSYNIKNYKLSVVPIANEDYTVTLKGQLGDGKECFTAYYATGAIVGRLTRVGESDLHFLTFNWSGDHLCTGIRIYTRPKDVTNVKSTIEWIKLEKGSKVATDLWYPAPEDSKTKDIKPQYYLSSSNKEPQDGDWQYDEPTWTSGKYIWTRSEITWENGDVKYTDPVLAGALNSANEKAENANNIAKETQDSLNARIVDWCVDANTTIIDGSKIATGTILTKNLNADAIQSLNYKINEGATFSNSGTFFDLDNGSITSKNFAIDAGGNVTIAGKITATSGYIGDDNNGFTIAKNDVGTYYLSNGQTSLDSTSKASGVYIAPDGIALGNGAFKVDKDGNVTFGSNCVITWQNTTGKPSFSSGISSRTATQIVRSFANGDLTYDRYSLTGTFISGNTIHSPNIIGGKLYAYNAPKTDEEGNVIKDEDGNIIYEGDGTKAYAEISGSYFTITPVGKDNDFDSEGTIPKLQLGYTNPNNDMENGGKIELILGAGWYSNDKPTVARDRFEFSKVKNGAEITYIDGNAKAHTIGFSQDGITGDFVAVFG
jgi:hypothetical protein